VTVRRRDFITLLGGAAAVWPLAARAQQAPLPVIGFLIAESLETEKEALAAFRRGLSETGYAEGQNVSMEYRSADGQLDRLPALAADLVGRKVTIIAAHANNAAVAARAATMTIPIVFAVGGDPVRMGLVDSLNRPGGNLTGVSFLSTDVVAKEMEVLRALVPNAALVGMLVNPSNQNAEADLKEAQAATRALGMQLQILRASNEREIGEAFAALAERHTAALLIQGDPYFAIRVRQLVVLTARHAIPAIYQGRLFPDAGGLISYGASPRDAFRIAGGYAGRILMGKRPAELPVQLATKIEFVINLDTAKALGIEVPATLLATADEVIE
jgi:putative ABC transport system substrate-binding protein